MLEWIVWGGLAVFAVLLTWHSCHVNSGSNVPLIPPPPPLPPDHPLASPRLGRIVQMTPPPPSRE